MDLEKEHPSSITRMVARQEVLEEAMQSNIEIGKLLPVLMRLASSQVSTLTAIALLGANQKEEMKSEIVAATSLIREAVSDIKAAMDEVGRRHDQFGEMVAEMKAFIDGQ